MFCAYINTYNKLKPTDQEIEGWGRQAAIA